MEKLLIITSYIKHLIKSQSFQKMYITSKEHFSASVGKIKFNTVMLFVLGRVNTLLDFEIANYCEKQKAEPFSSGAMSIARQKVSYEAFRSVLQTVSQLLPITETYKGYQLIAGDGSELQLPRSPELTQKYGGSKDNCRWPKAHIVTLYDVLNKFYLDAKFEPYPTDERQAVISMLDHAGNFTPHPQIYLLDRGFPSIGLIQKLNEHGKKFVFRAAKNFSAETMSFIKSGETDSALTITYNKSRTRTNRTSKGLKLPYSFDLRFVKVILGGGECEILITNAFTDEFTLKDIYVLYGLRWGIETSYNHTKNDTLIEQWGSILENSIKQEFYSALVIYNLAAALTKDVKVEYESKKNCVREFINTNMPLASAKS